MDTPEQIKDQIEGQTQDQSESKAHTLPEARQISRARARDLGTLLLKYARRHLPSDAVDERHTDREPERMDTNHDRLIAVLKIVPISLLALFATSFFWDFDGMHTSFLGKTLPLEGVLRIVSVSGMIGFLTNWIAITMLFQPRKRRPLLGQGLIPAQRERVVARLAQAVTDELINEDIIKQKIQESGVITKYRLAAVSTVRGVVEDPEFREEVKDLLVDYTGRVLNSKEVRTRLAEITIERLEAHAGTGIGGLALRMYRYFREEDFQNRLDAVIKELPKTLDKVLDQTDHLLDQIPARLEGRADDIERWATATILGFVEKMDIHQMIVENMQAYDERQLEELIKNSSNEQLNYIKYLGGVLGFFGGLVIWQPLPALLFFGGAGATVLGLDLLLGIITEQRT
ncbi:MAG: DUF445 domain-containing protein [Rhodothermia bacterium]